MKSRILLAALAALSISAVATAGRAAEPAPASALSGIEEADLKIVRAATDALAQGGARGLKPHLGALEEVLGRAPASYPVRERTAQGVITRMENSTDGAVAGISSILTGGGNKVSVQPNVYGQAAFLLGWAAVDRKDPKAALAWLDRGLAFQPDNVFLISERGAALTMQRRWADSLAAYESGLALDSFLLTGGDRATLLRGKGFALIELNRLDEAEAAYRQSLELVPDHGGALNELAYIDQLRGGGERAKSDVFTAKEAAARGKDAPADPK